MPIAAPAAKDGVEVSPPSPDTAASPTVAQLEEIDARLDAVLQDTRKAGGSLPQNAVVELKSIAGMLLTLAGEPPAEKSFGGPKKPAKEGAPNMQPTTKSVEMTRDQFVAWSLAQMNQAAKEPLEKALPRLQHVEKVTRIAKLAFEQTGAEPKPIAVEIETAFAAEGIPGTPMDLTTKADQEGLEKPASGTDTGNSQDSSFAQNAVEVIGKAVSALVAELTQNNRATPGTPVATDSSGATALTKRDEAGFVWPMDLAADDVEPEKEPVAKAADPNAWGSDPWATVSEK